MIFTDNRQNSLPTVTGDAEWTAERSSFIWTIDTVDTDSPTGSLEFRCDGDADAFFPVSVGFVAAGSLAEVDVSTFLRFRAIAEHGYRSSRRRW